MDIEQVGTQAGRSDKEGCYVGAQSNCEWAPNL